MPLVVATTAALAGCEIGGDRGISADWHTNPARRWVGPGLWANRLQDWRVTEGRLEATAALPMRTVHLLTTRLGPEEGRLWLSTTFGPAGATAADTGRSSAGLLIGAGRGLDYRAAALIHHASGPSAGLYAGVDTEGRLFLRDLERDDLPIIATDTPRGPVDSVSIVLAARPHETDYEIVVEAALWNAARDTVRVTTGGIPPDRLVGSVALVSDGRGDAGTTFWFSSIEATGSKLERHDERTAGPILGTQHTLSRGTLRLTAQLMPIGPGDERSATLEIQRNGTWTSVATADIIVPGYTATFTVHHWESTADTPFRVTYALSATDGTSTTYEHHGTVRREPDDKDSIVVAAFTGNHNVAGGVNRATFDWADDIWFPHADIVEHVRAHAPDVLFFSGDQVYEGASPTRADFSQPYEDYLYKWYLWLWAFGELTAEIPAITIPDDHDVFHGNVWGAGGRATPPGTNGAAAQDAGGYKLPADWVNMVQRTQTSHLPDPFDPTPVEQGIGVYYTDMLYGGVSFAVIEDRKFKSAPKPLLPRADVWNGWPLNPAFDPVTHAEHPDAVLLGERQLAFLDTWAADWRDGTWMKVVLSQTIFANVATLPDTARTGSVIPSLPILAEGDYAVGERQVADMDSNGWPQRGRNRALRAMRKGFAVHLAGDQHLGSTVQYGVEEWNDAAFALCVPSIANFWPRRWYPPERGASSEPGAPRYTGDFVDGFGNRITVFAVSNPTQTDRMPSRLHERAPGYGIARFERATRRITFEAWPRWADPLAGDEPYDGWPVTFDQRDSGGRTPIGHLPTLVAAGTIDPVVQVVREDGDAIVYTLRIRGDRFTPPVFASGPYTVRIGEPGTDRWLVLQGLEPVERPDTVTVPF
jgi:phosphodiesterase/alkaline phosphatase D-like protein